MKIALIQTDIIWNNPEANILHIQEFLNALSRDVSLVVLPEAFTTGFVMEKEKLEKTATYPVPDFMKLWAGMYGKTLAGSVFVKENGRFYNRMYWVEPSGKVIVYDKKHLFTYAGEDKIFTAGNRRVHAHLDDFTFRLNICYDLRFPVWNANYLGENGLPVYDVLLLVANWPDKRRDAYLKLLKARAVENQSYVIWVNRVGQDAYGNEYAGDSMLVSPKGEILKQAEAGKEGIIEVEIDKEKLTDFRKKFPFYRDWDRFTLES